MPPLTRYFIKTALVYFVGALIAGVLLLSQAVLNLPSAINALTPVYFHMLMVGWVTQLIFGMLFWMLPKYSKEKPRGNEKLVWIAFISINIGLVLRIIGEPITAIKPEWGLGWMLMLSAILQLLGGWAFIGNAWSRVKER